MPEGDTIHRLAAKLGELLEGHALSALELPRLAYDTRGFAGVRVIDVEARGKHLCIHLDNGRVLALHLGMLGRVYVSELAESRRPSARAVAILRTASHELVCVGAPTVRLVDARRLRFDRRLDSLGPDVLGEAFDPAVGAARLRALGDVALGVALLDQRAVAGLGNVWKSELCFLERLDPRAPAGAVELARLTALLTRGRALMRENVARGGPRATRVPDAEGRLYVYGRAGAPCLDCGATIESFHQGDPPRRTYHCPRCQA